MGIIHKINSSSGLSRAYRGVSMSKSIRDEGGGQIGGQPEYPSPIVTPPSPLAFSPCVIRSQFTVNVNWDITNVVPIGGIGLGFTMPLRFDYAYGTPLLNQVLGSTSQGNYIRALDGSKHFYIFNFVTYPFPTTPFLDVPFTETVANWTVKGKYLVTIDASLLRKIWQKCRITSASVDSESAVVTDWDYNLTFSYGAISEVLSDTYYTTYHHKVDVVTATGFIYTVTFSFSNCILARRSPDASDTTWINDAITW